MYSFQSHYNFGSPLQFMENGFKLQIGLNSWGGTNCEADVSQEVYTDIGFYYDWIQSYLNLI